MIRRHRPLAGEPDCGPEPEPPLRQQAQALELLPVLVRDDQDTIIYWSRGAEVLYGFSPEEALGQGGQHLLQTQLPEPLEPIQARLRSGRPWHGELTQTRKDGARIFVASQWVPGLDPHPNATVQIDTDITEHKQAEEAHDRLAAIVESSEDAIISKGLDGTITSWNPAAERLFGYRAGEILGRSINLIVPPRCQAEAAIVLERLRAGEHIEPFETVRLTKDARALDVSVTMSAVRDPTGSIIGASKIIRDISERKREEQAAHLAREVAHRRQIEQREQILSAMMEHIRLGIAIADAPAVTIRMVSRYGRNLLQKPKEQFVGAPAEQHPATFEFFHPDGTPATPEEMPLTRATVQGEIIKGEEWVVARRDGVHVPILCTAAPIRDQRERIIGGVMGWQDLTRRKQAEKALQKAQAELQAHADSLEKTVTERTTRLREMVAELEAFSYSVSHDLRAPIRSIHSYTEIALKRHADKEDPRTLELLQRIISCAESADRLIQDILALSRISRQHLPLAPVNLERLVGEVLQERTELQAAGAEIAIQGPLPQVLGHEPSLRQVLVNLLGNAVKYVAPGTRPHIQIWSEPGSIEPLAAALGAEPPAAGVVDAAPVYAATAAAPLAEPAAIASPWVRLYVQDNGIGIPPEEQGHIFELFHRAHTPQPYEGTGLGLAIVKKAVERMGGRVGVESTLGQGSRFWLQLPQAASTARAKTVSLSSQACPREGSG
jgi:PAS domain S-box-containing protein